MEELEKLQEEIIEEKFCFKEKKERVRKVLGYVKREQERIKEVLGSYGIRVEKIGPSHSKILGYLIKEKLKGKRRINAFLEKIPTTPRKLASYLELKSFYPSFELEPLLLGVRVGRRIFYVMNEDERSLKEYLERRRFPFLSL